MLITKITEGYVAQQYDTDKKRFVSQEFVAGDDVTYEDEYGNTVEEITPYLPFEMVQPKSRKKR